mmetsp:Transcript_8701/g.18734  ORF Transcript_8701/g.18734 Transcript_8701/m.18734 type:complete len:233 (-) Transcript_8701:46-744(-)
MRAHHGGAQEGRVRGQVHHRPRRRRVRVPREGQGRVRPRLQVRREHHLRGRARRPLPEPRGRLPHRHHRGSLRRGRLGELVQVHLQERGGVPGRRGRSHRDQHREDREGDRREGVHVPPVEGEPDRIHLGIDRRREEVEAGRVGGHDEPQVGGDGGHVHRRPGRGTLHGTDQDGRAVPFGEAGEVQPAAEDRGGAGGGEYGLRREGVPHHVLDGLELKVRLVVHNRVAWGNK